ncbi:MAG: DciA family protein [Actinomycetaceae bacterium]|nr:DciA family protein [Arcanobacterium sp.]MDD7505457.1 DciA family protein [Actinomycetaceae bacterium]MDY6144044.1 DciA family protein [Arcanobacterium sp.]
MMPSPSEKNPRIEHARRVAAQKYGDELPLSILDQARTLAQNKGWVRIKKSRTASNPAEKRVEDRIGDPVYEPVPGHDFGSGSRPSYKDPHLISQYLESVARQRGWKKHLDVGAIMARWPQIVGPHVAQHCVVEDYSDDGVLTLRTNSTGWQVQLKALSAYLDRRLAEEVGEGVIKDIVIKGPHLPNWRHGKYSVPGRGPRDTYDR